MKTCQCRRPLCRSPVAQRSPSLAFPHRLSGRTSGWGMGSVNEYLSKWETRLVTSDRSPGLRLSLALQCFGQSCRTEDLGGKHGRISMMGCPARAVWGVLGCGKEPSPIGPCDPKSAIPLLGPVGVDSHGLAHIPRWQHRGLAAPAPLGSEQLDCRTSCGGRQAGNRDGPMGSGSPFQAYQHAHETGNRHTCWQPPEDAGGAPPSSAAARVTESRGQHSLT